MCKIVVLMLAAAAAAFGLVSGTDAPFSPLATFYDIDVSTTASFFGGKSFGPGCARGGSIPDGFIAVAMNGGTMGVKDSCAICGMCIAIKGPAPLSANPADNVGVVGQYFGYVYEVCEDCTQSAGLQLGIPGAGQNSVVWRAIPCPNATGSSSPFLFFDGTRGDRARFQVRGLSAPLISAKVAGKPLAYDGSFLVLQGSTGHESVFPFTVEVASALGEQWSIQVPAYREFGPMTDLISVNKTAAARATTATAPDALSRFGSGEITTVSGPQTRTVRTMSQAGRQVVTITTAPRDDQAGQSGFDLGPALHSGPQSPTGMAAPPQSGPMTPPLPAAGGGGGGPAPRHSALYGGAHGSHPYGDLLDTSDFLSKPLGLDDLGGGGRYEQIRVPAGPVQNQFPSYY